MTRARPWARPTLLLVIGGVLLPNALFFALDTVLALPERASALCLYAAVALLCGWTPPALVTGLYLAVLATDLWLIVAQMFFLDIGALAGWLRMVPELDLLASPLYGVMIGTIGILAAANLAFLGRHAAAMAAGSRPALIGALLAVLGADILLDRSPGSAAPWAGLAQPFESAVERSDFAAVARNPGRSRHVLLVLVESLGVLRDRQAQALLLSPFDDPALARQFTVRTGTTTFFGATAHGEMRELCQSREPYRAVLAGGHPGCLPEAFAAHGFRTVSVHGFSQTFYERKRWYPLIGFVRSVFQENLGKPYRRCGGTFAGPCDVDLAETIRTRMAEAEQPLFVYWLTLNSHVPVKPGQATRRFGCETGGPFGDAEVCTMAEIWLDLFDAIKRIARDNPDAEILLAGDHAPPLWRRSSRELFEPDRVQWIRLSPRPITTAAGP
ncbi:sulfatase-like hydrolase/transferase [Methylobacterium sp. ID0610]|uniref:sulfatase-like hydrolase/transferase n=1 Tax=Methylobacterium carpenticola TaxID=3344827 RepID=UPI003693EE7F